MKRPDILLATRLNASIVVVDPDDNKIIKYA